MAEIEFFFSSPLPPRQKNCSRLLRFLRAWKVYVLAAVRGMSHEGAEELYPDIFQIYSKDLPTCLFWYEGWVIFYSGAPSSCSRVLNLPHIQRGGPGRGFRKISGNFLRVYLTTNASVGQDFESSRVATIVMSIVSRSSRGNSNPTRCFRSSPVESFESLDCFRTIL